MKRGADTIKYGSAEATTEALSLLRRTLFEYSVPLQSGTADKQREEDREARSAHQDCWLEWRRPNSNQLSTTDHRENDNYRRPADSDPSFHRWEDIEAWTKNITHYLFSRELRVSAVVLSVKVERKFKFIFSANGLRRKYFAKWNPEIAATQKTENPWL